jgi:glycosyltransferase involved in cell wall biosynthesis
MPKVSVILPNYNHEKYIDQRVESILCQELSDFELIILDDASTDNSVESLKKYIDDSRVKEVLVNDQNSGSPFIQWQKGLLAAEGEYIWIAESDDIADRRFLTEMVNHLDQNPNVGLVFCPSTWIDEKGDEIHKPSHEEDEEDWAGNNLIKNEFLIGNVVYNASSAVFRKSLIKKVNFNQVSEFKYTGDWMFWVQLVTNVLVKRTGSRFNFFRRHQNNVSFKSDKEGVQFLEGIKIANYIMKNHSISFGKKRKTMIYWAKKIIQSNVENPKEMLKNMPFEVRVWHKLISMLSK